MKRTDWELLQLIRDFSRKLLAGNSASHDWEHTERVLENAQRLWLAEGEQGDEFVICAAAYLHDIARSVDEQKTHRCHAEVGAEMAYDFLQSLAVDEIRLNKIVSAIASHRYRNRNQAHPSSIEDKIIFDADKLDSLGAIGIGRAFHFAGRIGAKVHNRFEEATQAEEFSIEDTAWREFCVKLKKIPERMQTQSGHDEAIRRLELMNYFFAQLNKECGYETDDL